MSWKRRVAILLAVTGVAAASSVLWVWWQVAASLPLTEGEVALAGLSRPVTIERDASGVPTLTAENRLDLARALGFLHAQERFFQMDLLRRRASGELAELLGPSALGSDRETRLQRFRYRARQVVDGAGADELKLLAAYKDGVNSGLAGLEQKPFEYIVLRQDPDAWREEDSVLVTFAMFFDLNDYDGSREAALAILYEALPGSLADFLAPRGGEWDAPLVGEAFSTPPIPGPEVFDLGSERVAARAALSREPREAELESEMGSNNWAVAGSRTAHGGALLANDMHLGHAVPNIWYRAAMAWQEEDGCPRQHRTVGVTLPGAPTLVAGSNSHVAWGYTNTMGDWVDLVPVEPDPSDAGRYLTPDGPRAFQKDNETIRVRGHAPEILEVVSTLWGPVIDQDRHGRRRALRWIAHDPQGVNLGMGNLEHARSLAQALDAASRSGIPPQNFVCADRQGHIGWTVMGKIPRRVGFDGRLPVSWADGSRRWDGWLSPGEYPRLVDPPSGILWTANARVVDGQALYWIGDGGYALGARAKQIRDDLQRLAKPTEGDLLGIQLDDRALFLARWRDLALELLTSEATEGRPLRAEFRKLVEETWTGRASVDSVAYRLVKAFRLAVFEKVYGALTSRAREADRRFRIQELGQWEGPLWKLVTERPVHLLDPRHASWGELLLAAVDQTIGDLVRDGRPLSTRTWGERNTVTIQHPLSRAIPLLSRWLDMPRRPLPGDTDMPRVQGVRAGASERFVVSPGREEDGIFHMPTGESGHPLAPYYRTGHEAWAEGRATPLLPGPTRSVLRLKPPGGA